MAICTRPIPAWFTANTAGIDRSDPNNALLVVHYRNQRGDGLSTVREITVRCRLAPLGRGQGEGVRKCVSYFSNGANAAGRHHPALNRSLQTVRERRYVHQLAKVASLETCRLFLKMERQGSRTVRGDCRYSGRYADGVAEM